MKKCKNVLVVIQPKTVDGYHYIFVEHHWLSILMDILLLNIKFTNISRYII